MPFIIFALSIGLTALSFISEKTDGLLSRIYVAGARPIEIVLSTFLAELVVLLIQVAFMLVFALLVFEIPMAGNLAFVVIVMTLMGFLGMTVPEAFGGGGFTFYIFKNIRPNNPVSIIFYKIIF